MKAQDFEEAFSQIGFDPRALCEENFQDFQLELGRFNNRNIARFVFLHLSEFSELLLFCQTAKSKPKRKMLLQSLSQFESVLCWFKLDRGSVEDRIEDIVAQILSLESGEIFAAFLSPSLFLTSKGEDLTEVLNYLAKQNAFQ